MNAEIYTVDYCPYCKKALAFFDEHNIQYTRHRIDDNEAQMRKKLGEMYDIKGDVTVPQIIIDGKRIGGYTDLIAAYGNGDIKF
ncbi:TPA: glutaredoxin 3 [Candidatus Galligastranaerophilus faecipullorum]|nr:glutaredoxin 3 [Candidatus Galligastranaerophilus faecipullorum]